MPIKTKIAVGADSEKIKASLAEFEKYRAAEATVMLAVTLKGLCGGSVSDDVMDFLAGHLAAARHAGLTRGFTAASETVQ